METIVKYKNRKLYSTTGNTYVSLDYITDLVRINAKFQVLDFDSKDDITTTVLKSALSKLDLSQASIVQLIKESK